MRFADLIRPLSANSGIAVAVLAIPIFRDRTVRKFRSFNKEHE
jgi:hypothetical protein